MGPDLKIKPRYLNIDTGEPSKFSKWLGPCSRKIPGSSREPRCERLMTGGRKNQLGLNLDTYTWNGKRRMGAKDVADAESQGSGS